MPTITFDSRTASQLTVNGDMVSGVVVASLLGGAGGPTTASTLAVTGATTLASVVATDVTASASLTVTGASIIGLEYVLTLDIPTLVTAGSSVYRFSVPFAGTITTLHANIYGGTLTTGNAVVTARIDATLVTTGVLTLNNGSVPGTTFFTTPSGANVVGARQDVNFTITGTQATVAARCTLTIAIRRSA